MLVPLVLSESRDRGRGQDERRRGGEERKPTDAARGHWVMITQDPAR
jgi:hypothetical protein